MSKFYDQQTWTDVVFHLTDGSSVRAHKLILAISSPVFEGMFYGPMADQGTAEFKVKLGEGIYWRYSRGLSPRHLPALRVFTTHMVLNGHKVRFSVPLIYRYLTTRNALK